MQSATTYVLPVHEAPFAAGFTHFTATREICPPGAEYGPQRVDYLCLFATESGGATAHIGGRVFAHCPGSLLVTPSACDLSERVNSGEPWNVEYLMMAGAWPDAFQQTLMQRTADGAEPFSGVLLHAAPRIGRHAVRCIVEAAQNGTMADHWRIVSLLTELFAQLTSSPATATDAPDPLLVAAHDLLVRHPERFWSVEELASALHISPRRLTYRLKIVAGISPALWMRQKRIAGAQRLLREGRTVTETSEAFGFANPYHFSRVFKIIVGVTPSEFRRQNAQSPFSLHRKNAGKKFAL